MASNAGRISLMKASWRAGGALAHENSVNHMGLWYLAWSCMTYWIVLVALQPYLCVRGRVAAFP